MENCGRRRGGGVGGPTGRTDPDFADGVSEALVGTELVEGDGVELALVQVGHRALALLLTQGAGGVQRVLEAVSGRGQRQPLEDGGGGGGGGGGGAE